MEKVPSRGLLESTFQILHDNATGTSFCLTIENIQYLITARHLFPKKNDNEKIKFSIWRDNRWNEFEATLLLHKNPTVDIAIIKLSNYLTNAFEIKTDADLIISDETYFLGFPFGIKQEAGPLNRGFPFPLVKKATISGVFGDNDGQGIFLDGHNNVGFSGGPIGHYDIQKEQTIIYGVISAYINHKNEITTPFGKFPFSENSGIIIGYGIKNVLDRLKK